jgi:hypothetical protein
MPFARPETALASTIGPDVESKAIRGKTTRPAACQRPSTTFQRLARRRNDLASDVGCRTSDLGPRTSDLGRSALGARTSDLRPRRSSQG